MHLSLLLDHSPSLLLGLPPLLVDDLKVFWAQSMLKIIIVVALCSNLSMQVVLTSNDFLKFLALGEEGFPSSLQFEHESAVVIVPSWGKSYLTILLLSSLISALLSWMSLSTWRCMPCNCSKGLGYNCDGILPYPTYIYLLPIIMQLYNLSIKYQNTIRMDIWMK